MLIRTIVALVLIASCDGISFKDGGYQASHSRRIRKSECGTDKLATLTRCALEEGLSSWAMNLLVMRQDLASLNCTGHNRIRKCIKVSGCPVHEVVASFRSVSNLFSYIKHTSILHSYYAFEYACSEEGQKIHEKHADCLTSHIGEKDEGLYLLETIDALNDEFRVVLALAESVNETDKKKKDQKDKSAEEEKLKKKKGTLCADMKAKIKVEVDRAKNNCVAKINSTKEKEATADDIEEFICKTISRAFIHLGPNYYGIVPCGEMCRGDKADITINGSQSQKSEDEELEGTSGSRSHRVLPLGLVASLVYALLTFV